MRKTTLSRSLLLTAALALGATSITAQTASQTPVGSLDELTDGYYVIKATPNDGSFSGLVYCDLNDGADRHFRVDQDKQAYADGTLETAYIWRLTRGDDGTFTLMGMHDNLYIPADEQHNQNFRGTKTANLQITVGNDENGGTAGAWYVTMTNYKHSDAATYWYNNKPGGNPNLSWWENIGNGAMQVEFYAISDLPETVNVTYNAKYTGDGRILGTAGYELFIGDTYPTPELSDIPDYVTVGNVPEGTVSAEQTIDINCTWEGPFAISESVQNATWYAVGLHTAPYYLHNTEGAESMTLAAEQQTIDASTIEAFNAQMWCFVGNPFDGFKIYNKAAGEGKILSSGNPAGADGTTFPILVDEASLPEGNNTTWDILPSTNIPGINGFYIAQHGIAANKMNRRDGKLAYWTGSADDGSTFRVLNITDLYKTEIAPDLREEAQGENVGMFTPDAISAHREAINSLDNGTGTPEQYVEVYNARTKIIPGNYYRIVSGYSEFETQQGVKKAIYNDGTSNIKWGSLDMADADFIFQIEEADEAGKYLIKNANRDLYMAGVKGLLDTKENALSGSGAISLVQLIPGEFNIEFGNGTMHAESHQSGAGTGGALVQWDGGEESGSSWCIVPATTLDVTMNTVGDETWATLYLPFSVTTPEGVTAYTGTQKDENTVGLTDVENGIVPARTGVVLKGTETACQLALTNDAVAPIENNVFTGTCLPISVTPGTLENYYVLSTLNGVIGLYWPMESTTELAANKAFIEKSEAAGATGYRFIFGDDTTVGIGDAVLGQPTDAPYYDLTGRRVAQPAKGIYIHNGKKVFIK